MSDNKANRFRFRAWVFGRELMIEPDCIYWQGQKVTYGAREFYTDLYPEIASINKEDHCVLMQSTGLLDRNQKEIFEGDICRFGPGIIPSTYEILWDKTRWLGKHGKELIDLLLLQKQSFDFASEYYCEVIGNCYENPELLK